MVTTSDPACHPATPVPPFLEVTPPNRERDCHGTMATFGFARVL
jgi:hypothetical protein